MSERPRTRSAIGFTIAMALCLALPLLAQQTKEEKRDEAFRKGLDARDEALKTRDQAKWREVASFMRAAIEQDRNENARRIARGIEKFSLGAAGTEYTPHFFLAEAASKFDGCVEALDAWAESEKQRVVKGERLKEIEKGRAECAKQGVLTSEEFQRVSADAHKEYEQASARYRRLEDSLKGSNRYPKYRERLSKAQNEVGSSYSYLERAKKTRKKGDLDESRAASRRAENEVSSIEVEVRAEVVRPAEPAISPATQAKAAETDKDIAEAKGIDAEIGKKPLPAAQQTARSGAIAELADADRGLAAWRQDTANLSALDTASKAARSAVTTFKGLRDEVTKREAGQRERQRQDRLKGAQDALVLMSGSFDTYDNRAKLNADRVRDEWTKQRDDLKKSADRLGARLTKAATAGEIPELTDIQRKAEEVTQKVLALAGEFGPLSLRERGVDASLEEGARLFLAGDYERAITALDAVPVADDLPLKLHIHLFRAASEHALFVRSGEMDQARLARARAEIERCKEINSGFRPDERVFAPGFLKLFTGPTTAPAPAGRQSGAS